MRLRRRISLLALLGWGAVAQAQVPFSSPASSPGSGTNLPPPRTVPLIERKWAQLSNQAVSADGKLALAMDPAKWKHAESDSFILHYRRATEAQKVVREIEYDLWFVAKTLGARREIFALKLHVFVFEDEAEWEKFVVQTNAPSWSSSFAHGDELFLSVRRTQAGGRFDSQSLAHETTHAVVARLYPQQHWPVWLGEGFAEYMGSASVAARKNQTVKRHERTLTRTGIPLSTLVQIERYPSDLMAIGALYESSEKLVRFLMTEFPPERITRFIEAMLKREQLKDAVQKIYGDQVPTFEAFEKRYERFSK